MIKIIDLAATKEVVLVKFGTGDIMFHGIESDQIKYALGFSQHEPRPIGSETNEYEGRHTDDLQAVGIPVRVVFEFTKPESVSSLIHSLIELQKKMFDDKNSETKTEL